MTINVMGKQVVIDDDTLKVFKMLNVDREPTESDIFGYLCGNLHTSTTKETKQEIKKLKSQEIAKIFKENLKQQAILLSKKSIIMIKQRSGIMAKDRINISLDAETLAKLKELAMQQHCSASQMVTQLIWSYEKKEND